LAFVIVVTIAYDVEESMTAEEMIAHWGYPVESYDITTEDGYILKLLRIPHGRSSSTKTFLSDSNSACHRPPILFVHGFMMDASAFVLNPPESSPGMILADAGFDVFLLTVRGTSDSQRHLKLTKKDAEYWKFSMDEMAKYDVPAAIDAVLSLSGAESLYYVGHSQGTMISFLMLSQRPEYNEKVRALFELSPSGTGHSARGVSRLGQVMQRNFHGVFD
ncbi:hypothetical protein PENTCL1PPCAC_5557, partial [Pristionchus entomophagus]